MSLNLLNSLKTFRENSSVLINSHNKIQNHECIAFKPYPSSILVTHTAPQLPCKFPCEKEDICYFIFRPYCTSLMNVHIVKRTQKLICYCLPDKMPLLGHSRFGTLDNECWLSRIYFREAGKAVRLLGVGIISRIKLISSELQCRLFNLKSYTHISNFLYMIRQGKVMFSQVSVSYSVHNRPHGYWNIFLFQIVFFEIKKQGYKSEN